MERPVHSLHKMTQYQIAASPLDCNETEMAAATSGYYFLLAAESGARSCGCVRKVGGAHKADNSRLPIANGAESWRFEVRG